MSPPPAIPILLRCRAIVAQKVERPAEQRSLAETPEPSVGAGRAAPATQSAPRRGPPGTGRSRSLVAPSGGGIQSDISQDPSTGARVFPRERLSGGPRK